MIIGRRIVLIGWYAFDAEDIEIRGDAAFVGNNGAGKSSILDAVQLLLTGGNKNYFRPNARADDGKQRTGRRTVRDYCLGKLSNSEGSVSLRAGGPSYIALSLFDEAAKRPISFGIALYADPLETDAKIDGLFVAPGLDVAAVDFLIGAHHGAPAAPWTEVRARLERNSVGFRSFREQSGAFVKTLLQHVRGRGGQAEPEQWLRALRLAAQFKGVEDPNQFVRDHILPDEPLDLPELREDSRRYTELVQTIRILEAKEQQLEAVHNTFAAHFEKATEARRNNALAALARREIHHRSVENGKDSIAKYQSETETIASQIERAEEGVAAARVRLADAKRALETDPTAAERAVAGTRREHAKIALERANEALAKLRKALADVARRIADAEGSGVKAPALRARFEAAADVAALADHWPRDPEAVQAALASVPEAEVLCATIEQAIDGAARQVAEAETRARDAVDRLEAAKAGGPILRRETTALLRALEAEGMAPVPLCSVVELTDPEWTEAVETLLGAGREAILVEAGQVRDAVRRVRRERASFYGCTIVQVAGMERFGGVPRPDSLAAVVRTSDPRARAFLNQRLGGIRRVETEAELERAERAVTRDCQYAAGGGIQNRRPERDHILGRRYTEADVQRFIAERDAAVGAYTAAKMRSSALSAASARLRDATATLHGAGDFAPLLKARREADTELDLATMAIADLEARVPKELERAVKDAQADLKDYEEELKASQEARVNNARALASAETALQTAERELQEADEAISKLPLHEGDMAAAEAVFAERLAGRHGPTYIVASASQAADLAHADARARLGEAERGLLSYWQRHNEAPIEAADTAARTLGEAEGKARWVRERLERLRTHELRQYKEAVVEMEAKVKRSLRENLFLALSSRISRAQELIKDLNRHLKKRVFHRERYVFTAKPRPDYEDIFRAVEAVKEDPGLFDDAPISGGGEDTVSRGVARIMRMLENDGDAADADIKALADYRGYFIYDVEMRAEGTDRFITTLSERIRTGSGGEKEAPSYVAVGTALAAANCIEPSSQPEDIGMALALFDEAFSKLDDANIGNILDLLRTLGLQMLVAAPTSKRFAFMSRFETVVDVVRVEDRVTLQVHHLDEKARRMMREDNPYEMTFEQWAQAQSQTTTPISVAAE